MCHTGTPSTNHSGIARVPYTDHFLGSALANRCVLVACALAVASLAAAESKSYVVSAARWGAAAAGGQVTFQHDGAGLAVVTSENPDFATVLAASGAVQSVDEDAIVQWQRPTNTVLRNEATDDPSNDTLYTNIQWSAQAVDAPGAWAAGYAGAGVRVAILDGGIHSAQ